MITIERQVFHLATSDTSYVFSVSPSGHLEHLHYGDRMKGSHLKSLIQSDDSHWADALKTKTAFLPGNTLQYGKEHPQLCLETLPLECSSLGKGDVREPLLSMTTEKGLSTSDFLYVSYRTLRGKADYEGLPSSYGSEDEVETLVIVLKDTNSGAILELKYHVYETVNVISRSAVLTNQSSGSLTINRLLSMQLDLGPEPYVMTTFNGAWAREMQKHATPLIGGTVVNSSRVGTSSNRSNPFFMVSKPETTEDYGSCYGFNLVYSGNHYSGAEVSGGHQVRIVTGINPHDFSFVLAVGEQFQTPEAILSYSSQGFNGLSGNMHAFVRRHIVRGYWRDRERPVLINSWEVFYFKFNEKKLLKLAKKASDIGVELFVLDDGWFGQRSDDKRALGDWTVNDQKIPGGLKALASRINAMGMSFGIWVEPEMVNADSDCYRAHPHWAVRHPEAPHSEGRNQMILDLTNPEVQDYLILTLSGIFSSANIAYVKWDMNRIFSDVFGQTLRADQQKSFNHRYMLGLYRVLKHLTEAFPQILFEGCASGGNRFDLGMLCYMPQIWASDNTDAISRLDIQGGYSYGYPLSVMGAHVSDTPNHQTLRQVPLETRYNVASFGLLGYECNLLDYDQNRLKALKNDIQTYKEWRRVFQFGLFYRIINAQLKDGANWMVVSEDGSKAVVGLFQKLVVPNQPNLKVYCRGLDPEGLYRFFNRPYSHSVKRFGDLINTVSPLHIKNGSLLQNLLSGIYTLKGETESYTISGSVLNTCGVKLKQGFCGVGFNDTIRLFQDFDSRVYYMERVKAIDEGE